MDDHQLDYYAPNDREEDSETDYMASFPIDVIEDDTWDYIGY